MGTLEELIRQNIAQRKVIRAEPKHATAATLATKKLRSLGLSREEHNALWQSYRKLYYQRRTFS